MQPLRPMKLFTISMDESNQSKAVIQCYCTIAPLDHNTCQLALSDDGRLTMKCSSITQPDLEELEWVTSYQEENWSPWIANLVDMTNDAAHQRTGRHFRLKYRTLVECSIINSHGNSYSKLALPRAITNFPVPIQPGLFKGMYAEKGIQLILLNYVNQRVVRATKITV